MMFARLDFSTFLVCCSGDLSDTESEEKPSVAICGGSICILTGLIRSPSTVVVDGPARWSRPADCARGEVMRFQHFTFGWHTAGDRPNQHNRRSVNQGDCDGVLFGLLSNSAVSYMVIE